MPTYQEMQAHKAMKARRALAAQNKGQKHRHHQHSEHPAASLTPAGPTTQSFDHLPLAQQPALNPNLANISDPNLRNVLGEILMALQSRPAHMENMTPLALTPVGSRVPKAQNGQQNTDIKRSDTSVTSCSSNSDSDDDEEEEDEIAPNPWARFRNYMREPFAEFLGTCILVLFGSVLIIVLVAEADIV